LVPAEFAASTTDLRLDRVAEIGRFRYAVLIADDLSQGQRASVGITGLPFTPRPWWLDEAVQRAAAAMLALIGVMLAWAYARAQGRPAAQPPTAARTPRAETVDL
jgi:hypothetical protein